MNICCKDILYNIFEFAPNEDIFNLLSVSKYYKEILTDTYFFKHIKYRYHPIVFNIIDNLCKKCNLGLFFITEDNFDTLTCRHF